MWVIMLLVGVAGGCHSKRSTEGLITIRNDIQDKDFNIIEIDQIVTTAGQGGYDKRLSPGEAIRLPFKTILSFRVTREYPDHDKVYLVKCPMNLENEVTMKLLDIHIGKISGGCRLAQKGKRIKGGYIKWE